MNELVKELMSKADLDQAMAEKAVGVVKEFIKDKLPETVSTPVMSAIDGLDVDDAVDMLKKLF